MNKIKETIMVEDTKKGRKQKFSDEYMELMSKLTGNTDKRKLQDDIYMYHALIFVNDFMLKVPNISYVYDEKKDKMANNILIELGRYEDIEYGKIKMFLVADTICQLANMFNLKSKDSAKIIRQIKLNDKKENIKILDNIINVCANNIQNFWDIDLDIVFDGIFERYNNYILVADTETK